MVSLPSGPAGDPLVARQQDWAIVAAPERSMGLAAPRVREPEEIRLDLQYCPAVEDPAIGSGQN